MNSKEFFSQLRNTDFDDLRPSNIARWTLPIRVIVCFLIFVLAVSLYYYVRIQSLNEQLATAETREVTLKRNYNTKARRAANLDAYRLQMKELEIRLDALVQQLPTEKDVPDLLEDITDTGLSSGLVIRSIELQPERVQEYYVELPIRFEATGGYHDFATFISGVAGLPRIVTMHDFDITREAGGVLKMVLNARTYRYRPVAAANQGGQ